MDTPIATNSLVMGALVERHAKYRPRHLAIVAPLGDHDERLDWSELDAYVNRCASVLALLGVERGDRVATLLTNSLPLLAIYWACAKLGAAVMPLSPLLNASGVVSLLTDATPRVVVSSRDRVELLQGARAKLPENARTSWLLINAEADDVAANWRSFEALMHKASSQAPRREVRADDLWTLMYSSGTTGTPKGICHTHFIRAMYATLLANSFRVTPESVMLHAGALVFNGAMVMMLPAFLCGATLVLHRAFDADAFIDTVERERVTHVMLVPAQIIAILNAARFDAERLASLQCILSLGAPLHLEYKQRLNDALPGRFHELYGLTEGFITILDRDDSVRKAGSVGVPPPFYEIKICDEEDRALPTGEVGEIVGRGPITMPCYWKRPDETSATLRNDWLYTGDLGYLDDEGFLFLVDRKKDMIDSGGVKVYPKDIEEIVAHHPDVREVAVFGIPHEKWGETPIAAVVLRDGANCDADELRDWINARVAARYQRVERVVVLDDFPRNAAGKTLKRALREPYWVGREKRI
ncbi:MAG TPA: AMP-binding protein [Casimicrobiaceae bacterium]|nr:AMP-binding protein [Casimicrobiaceae bacterium]